MLELEKALELDTEAIKSPNLASRFSEVDQRRIADHVHSGYEADQASRSNWLKRNEAGMELTMQITKAKSFPWPECSNVAFPLLTVAVLQFQAFAYPEIVSNSQVVRYREVGDDPDGSKGAAAAKIGKHMSYQLLEEDIAWEEQHDRLLINIPVVGCAFKKSDYRGDVGHNVSELVMAKDLVMDYYAKSVETCMRKTHVIQLSRNDVYFRVKTEVFLDVLEEAWYTQPAQPLNDPDGAGRLSAPESDDDTPFTFLEQHCWLDLDQDGYAEPYIVTVEENSKALVRIVCRFDRPEDIIRAKGGSILRIVARELFTKYGFIPSPDGSIYDLGFGVLLGPLNEVVNSLVNQLVDAGTMANKAGGFIGKGMRMRGGVYSFSPLEWKVVNATGDDIKKSIFPLPVREPSNVLLQLLQLIIQYANRIPGATEAASGENPGQNTPAETHRTSVEQSLKLYNAIFKRVWRSMREEFKKLYILNALYLPETSNGGMASAQDYRGDPTRVAPVADPHVLSDSIKMAQAQQLCQRASAVNGYNKDAVEKNLLKALKVDNVDVFYPGPDKVPPLPNPKMAVEQMKMQVKETELKLKQGELKLKQQIFLMDLLEEKKVNSAKIELLKAQSQRVLAEIKEGEREHMLALIDQDMEKTEQRNTSIMGQAKLMMDAMEKDHDWHQQAGDQSGGVPGMATPASNAGAPGGAPQGAGGNDGSIR